MDVEQLYQDIILDHYREKHNHGLRPGHDVEVMHVNPSCGDELKLRVKLNGDIIEDISYEGDGCSISQASTSVMTDLCIGRSIHDCLSLHDDFREMMESKGQIAPDEDRFEDAIAFAGVAKFPVRVKCAMLAWSAMKDGVSQAVEKIGEE